MVEKEAFSYCKKLKHVELAENSKLEKLGEYAFAHSAIESIEIPNNVSYIGERCFEASAIENVRLPFTLKRIEKQTFCGCQNLKRVEIPNGVE